MFLAIQSHTDCREAQATLCRGQARLGWTLPFPKLASSLVFVLRIQAARLHGSRSNPVPLSGTAMRPPWRAADSGCSEVLSTASLLCR